ncbi:unnamed protein product [Camellia sinensis]
MDQSQKSPSKTKATPENECCLIAFHANAPSISSTALFPVNKSCQAPKKKGPNWNIGYNNVVVDTKVFHTEEIGGCGDCNGSDCSSAYSYGGSTDVEGDGGPVEE